MSEPNQTEAAQDQASPSPDETPRKFSPFAGCSIFIIAGVLVISMLGFTTWSYFKVKRTIAEFTGETPQTIETADLADKESAQIRLKEKLVGFRHQIEAGHKNQIALNADEMNLAIATFDILKPHRTRLHVESIEGGHIEARIAFPVKAGMGSENMRFINATILIEPELVEGAAFPRITKVNTNTGTEMPEQFRQFISETLLHPVREDKELGPLFSSLSGVHIEDNALILETDPQYQPVAQPSPETRQSMFERLMTGFAVIAAFFLAIVAFIIILSRRKAK